MSQYKDYSCNDSLGTLIFNPTNSVALEKIRFEVTNFIGCGRVPYLWKSMIISARLK
nr:hypothetical protein [uncultured Pedobacter sp.]